MKMWAILVATVLVTASVSYSATLLSVRFLDMQNKVTESSTCQSEFSKRMPKP